ncbi:MAG: biopolymer transporter ExbD [Betaproteobacteria bacterium]|nr:biopolymer transporter ExbD [Betaproteobacteria bacterium]
MAFMTGSRSEDGEDAVLATINTTPLVDVMLVLLIIFLITIPVVTHTIPLQLPKETSQPNQPQPQTIHLSVDRAGVLYWEQMPVDLSTLQQRLIERAKISPQPAVHIRGDQRAQYEPIGRIILACQRAGLTRVGFITEPPVQH